MSSARNSRRDSTILAGNLTILDSDSDDESGNRTSILANTKHQKVTGTGKLKQNIDQTARLQEITEDEEADLITEDESNFYSCAESQDGSPLNTGGITLTSIASGR